MPATILKPITPRVPAMRRRHAGQTNRMAAIPTALFLYLVCAVCHYAFRYVLQMSDSVTSPAYHDTPTALKLIKDALLGGLLAAVAVSVAVRRRVTVARGDSGRLAAVALLAISAVLMLAALRVTLLGQPMFDVILGFRTLWLPAILVVVVALVRPNEARDLLARLPRILVPIMLAFQAVTVALYLFAGRLPALSYVGLPRFGGILDDPNGYGVLCVLMIALLWARARRRWLVALSINVLMTVSLSAYVVFGLFLALQLVRVLPHLRARAFVALTTGLSLGTVLAYALWLRYGPQVEVWWAHKSRSVADHAESSANLARQIAPWNNVELLVGVNGTSETQVLLTLYQSGVIGLGIQVALAAALVYMALRARQTVGAWGLAVLIAMSFIPYLQVYPISALFWGVLALTVRAASHPDARH